MLFLESPWPILVIGLVVEAALAIALFRSGRAVILWAMAGTALVVLLGLLLEHATITDTKLVRQTLEEAAAGVQANNAQRVIACIVPGPDGQNARDRTVQVLGMAHFQEVSLSNVEVKINYQTSPPTVVTKFTALVRGSAREGGMPEDLFRPVPMEVRLRKESGRWLIYGEPKYDVRE